MKKIVASILMMCMILTLAACGMGEITMQKVYDAAQTKTLLKNRQSVSIRNEADGELFSENYLTKEYVFDHIPGIDAESDWAEFMTDDAYYCYMSGHYMRYLPITPDGVNDDVASLRAERYTSVILEIETVDEIIESVSEADGRITVKSVMSEKNIENMAEFGVVSGKSEYVLDAKTRKMISLSSEYTYEDGLSNHMASEISYDTEAPEMVNTFLAYDNQKENLRTITVVNNPGTEKETSKSIQAPKGLIIGLRYDEDTTSSFEVYDDAACTKAHDPYTDTDSDLTIYVKWTE